MCRHGGNVGLLRRRKYRYGVVRRRTLLARRRFVRHFIVIDRCEILYGGRKVRSCAVGMLKFACVVVGKNGLCETYIKFLQWGGVLFCWPTPTQTS